MKRPDMFETWGEYLAMIGLGILSIALIALLVWAAVKLVGMLL